MLRPDSVRRVTPPTTMTAKTSVDERRSQRPTPGGGRIGAEVKGSTFGASFGGIEKATEENLWRREETWELGERLKAWRTESKG